MKYQQVELGVVASFIRGVTFKPGDVSKGDGAGTVACMRTSNVQKDLETTDVWRIPRALIRRSDQYLRSGDILVSSANSWNLVGKCCWVPDLPDAATFGGFVSAFRADPSQLHPRYAYWWFSSPHTQQIVRSFGRRTTSISNLDLARCLRLNIPLPPPVEQRRIAGILDAAEIVRRRRQVALALVQGLAASVFASEFGDPLAPSAGGTLVRLSDLLREIRIGPFGSALHRQDYVRGGVPVVNPMHISDGVVVADPGFAVSRQKRDELSAYVLRRDDVVLGRRGEMGRCAVIGDCEDGYICGTGSMILRPDPARSHPIYLQAVLSSRSGRAALVRSSLGATMANLNKGIVGNLRVRVPPIVEQRAFARSVVGVEALARVHGASRDAVERLFASLYHRAFTGAL